MLFNSLQFLVFLPLVFVFYWFVFRRLKWQNAFVVVASYVFYGWWNWHFLLLIFITSLCSYASGLLIDRAAAGSVRAKAVVAANLLINLGILGLFKYYNFFAESFSSLLSALGMHADLPTLKLILPVGISFYTFQALSYTIDVYRRRLPATRDAVAFFAYISFFPQLVAGPIERATQLLPQMQRQRTFSYEAATDGMRQMLWGFFKKMVVADNCALVANAVWADCANQSSAALAVGALMFTLQIYGDFSGYSDIAIGTARLFGINLSRNFDFPYFARNVSEFWRKWHISLMSWLTDYIYIPLGGNRVSRLKNVRNVGVVFLVSGLWHGANWTFVAWGVYHALLFIPLRIMGVKGHFDQPVAAGKVLPSVKELCQMLLTFALVVVGWILFRSDSMAQAMTYMHGMAAPCSVGEVLAALRMAKMPMAFGVVMIIAEWLQRTKQHALQIDGNWCVPLRMRSVRWALYVLIGAATVWFQGAQQSFIYFQF